MPPVWPAQMTAIWVRASKALVVTAVSAVASPAGRVMRTNHAGSRSAAGTVCTTSTVRTSRSPSSTLCPATAPFAISPPKRDAVLGDYGAADPARSDRAIGDRITLDRATDDARGDHRHQRRHRHPTGQPHVHQHAALKARQYEKTMAWQALLLPEVARRLGLSEPRADDLAPAALAACVLACLDAAVTTCTT